VGIRRLDLRVAVPASAPTASPPLHEAALHQNSGSSKRKGLAAIQSIGGALSIDKPLNVRYSFSVSVA
jgi:hypothetical protein